MKSKRIEIRGVIVPADFDVQYLASYIDRGIITPENRIRAALQGDEDIELYINSPGGSVLCGNEIINAIHQAREAGRTVSITVGAWAASMAAGIVLASPADQVKAHKNSKILFHGCTNVAWGGEQAHRDQAEALAKMNEDFKAELIRRGSDEADVNEWFAEGRQEIMTADEALSRGVIGAILNKSDKTPAVKVSEFELDDLAAQHIQIAACVGVEIEATGEPEAKEDTPAVETPIVKEPPQVEEEPTNTAEDPHPDPQDAAPVDPPPTSSDEINDSQMQRDLEQARAETESYRQEAETVRVEMRAMQATKDKEIAAIKKQLADHEANTAKLEADWQAQRQFLQEEKQKTDARLARLTAAALAVSDHVPVTWAEALAKADGDHVKAKQMFPDLHAQIIAEANNRKKS
jgi:ATP-dependent protease ClpP protease subunit